MDYIKRLGKVTAMTAALAQCPRCFRRVPVLGYCEGIRGPVCERCAAGRLGVKLG